MKKVLMVLLLSAFGMSAYAQSETYQEPQMNADGQVTTQQAAPDPAKAGQAFLETNKARKGVVTTPSGLQYEIVIEGNGPKPKLSDTVTVRYEGKLINGKVFDSNMNGAPATFPVAGVIPGWVEALQLMPAGSTWMLYIPSDLAYGQRGAPPVIGPNEVLIFKVALIAVKPA